MKTVRLIASSYGNELVTYSHELNGDGNIIRCHKLDIIGIYSTLAFACYNNNAIKRFFEEQNIIHKETEFKRLSILPPLVFDLMVL